VGLWNLRPIPARLVSVSSMRSRSSRYLGHRTTRGRHPEDEAAVVRVPVKERQPVVGPTNAVRPRGWTGKQRGKEDEKRFGMHAWFHERQLIIDPPNANRLPSIRSGPERAPMATARPLCTLKGHLTPE